MAFVIVRDSWTLVDYVPLQFIANATTRAEENNKKKNQNVSFKIDSWMTKFDIDLLGIRTKRIKIVT